MGAKIEPESPASPSGGSQQGASGLHAVSSATGTTVSLPDKRPLSENELHAARKVFVSALDYLSVRVEKMGALTELINGSRAYTIGNTINLPSMAYAYPDKYTHIVIHELVHVWQYQHGGWGYVPSAALAQTLGDGYDFAKALRDGKPWTKMNPEQQAQMIQDAYRGVYFDTPFALFGVLNDKGCVVRSNTKPPDGFTDYTSALEEALAVIRKGS